MQYLLPNLLFLHLLLGTDIICTHTRGAPSIGDAGGTIGEWRHAPSTVASTQEAELIGAIRVPNALNTAVVVTHVAVTSGAVIVAHAHNASAVGSITDPKSAIIIGGTGRHTSVVVACRSISSTVRVSDTSHALAVGGVADPESAVII